MAEDLNVLVVDDEPDVCWALKTLLQKQGFTVVTVTSGAQALWWLNETDRACRLILVDAKLGDIEGIELAKQIRINTSCAAPMILVSGYFYKDDSMVQESLSSGLIAAFVTKPFHHDEIMHAIHAVLPTIKIAH